MNRSILADILGEEYEIMEAEDGVQAIAMLQKYTIGISAVLLDIVMPNMDGFEVLTVMNQRKWIEDTPVIMISAETDSSQVERAYDLGATDFITRPFDAFIVHRRVVNTIFMYTKQKKLVGLVVNQVNEKERQSNMMVDILSHIVEFRNGESNKHILHVRTFTQVMLRQLQKITDRYSLTQADIALISTASSLHDIGKIAIDEKILNKPGKLTDEEFEVMKTHSQIGASMLENLPSYHDEPLVKTAYQICRWHHERYDGRGYPDGLKGDEIPISAQIVALADVYDALTSERCYKKAFSHDTAIKMITNGECGVFNPLLMECLRSVEGILEDEFSNIQEEAKNMVRSNLVREMFRSEKIFASERSLQLLDKERMKFSSFSALTEDIQFEYTAVPDVLTLSAWGAKKLGMDEVIVDPRNNERIRQFIEANAHSNMCEMFGDVTPDDPMRSYECQMHVKGELRWHRIIFQALWSDDEEPVYTGFIGKAIDIHDSHIKIEELEKKASCDGLTGLLNQAAAKKSIHEKISEAPDGKFTLAIIDLDKFKAINDTYGHVFGNRVLQHVSSALRKSVRSNDVVARIGGDEFLAFMRYDADKKADIKAIMNRVFNSLSGDCEGIPVSVSMGIALSDVVEADYEVMFHAADQALYSAKRGGRSKHMFYDDSMQELQSNSFVNDDEGAMAQEKKEEV